MKALRHTTYGGGDGGEGTYTVVSTRTILRIYCDISAARDTMFFFFILPRKMFTFNYCYIIGRFSYDARWDERASANTYER